MRPVLVLQNISREGPGLFEIVAKKRNIDLEILNLNESNTFPPIDSFEAVIVCGGPDSVNDDTQKIAQEIDYIKEVINRGIPYFGICLGMQVLAKAAGAYVMQSPIKEVGFSDPIDEPFVIELNDKGKADPIFKELGSTINVFQLHGEAVEPGIIVEVIGIGKWCPTQIIKYGINAYGIQSHIELTEEMFYQWLDEDDDLIQCNRELLISDYKKIKDNYESTGMTICNNFFDLITQVKN